MSLRGLMVHVIGALVFWELFVLCGQVALGHLSFALVSPWL